MLEVPHQGPGDSVFCESYLPDMQMAAFLLCQHLAFLVCMCQEREGGGSGVSSFSYKDISPFRLLPPKSPISKHSYIEIKASTYNCLGMAAEFSP